MHRSLDMTGIEYGNEHITVFKYFHAELYKHLMKYRNIYVLETKYMIIINYAKFKKNVANRSLNLA